MADEYYRHESEWWEEDARRHNEVGEFMKRMGWQVPSGWQHEKLRDDGSLDEPVTPPSPPRPPRPSRH